MTGNKGAMKIPESNKRWAKGFGFYTPPIGATGFVGCLMNLSHYRFQVSTVWLLVATWLIAAALLYLLVWLTIWCIDWREKKKYSPVAVTEGFILFSIISITALSAVAMATYNYLFRS